jgi:hypothetical protein
MHKQVSNVDHNCPRASLKQLCMGSGADEVDGVSTDLVDQKKVTADMAFAAIGPFAF